VLNKPILVPESDVTSLGSVIFAFLAAGAFRTVEEAQDALCPPHRVFEPEPAARAACDDLFGHYRQLYFALGSRNSVPVSLGSVLPALREIAAKVKKL
jgi:L-ribulokinase